MPMIPKTSDVFRLDRDDSTTTEAAPVPVSGASAATGQAPGDPDSELVPAAVGGEPAAAVAAAISSGDSPGCATVASSCRLGESSKPAGGPKGGWDGALSAEMAGTDAELGSRNSPDSFGLTARTLPINWMISSASFGRSTGFLASNRITRS